MAPVSSADTGLYIHFPYCEKKCPYCDFNSHAIPHDDRRYADALIKEIDARAPAYGRPFRTVFFGGGTPSLFAPREVGRVLRHVRETHGLAPNAEITLETNPGTVEAGLFEAFVEAGVGRFSIGIQSFIDAELLALGRIHDAAAAKHAVRAARASGARVSLDLIYGLPNQSTDAVRFSIDEALALGTEHVSAYTLTIEPDTHFGRLHAAGRYEPMDDDGQADLIELVTARLAEAGFERYEVSNYAKAGAYAQHNALYWVGGAYLGVGAGASSYRPGPGLERAERRMNVKAPELYLYGVENGATRAAFEEHVDARTVAADRVLLGLRTIFGVDLADLRAGSRHGPALADALAQEAEGFVTDGLLRRDGEVLRPTDRGFLFVDRMVFALSAALDRVQIPDGRVRIEGS